MSGKRKTTTQPSLDRFVFKRLKTEHQTSPPDINLGSAEFVEKDATKKCTSNTAVSANNVEDMMSKTTDLPILPTDIYNYVNKSNLTDKDTIIVMKNIWTPDV